MFKKSHYILVKINLLNICKKTIFFEIVYHKIYCINVDLAQVFYNNPNNI